MFSWPVGGDQFPNNPISQTVLTFFCWLHTFSSSQPISKFQVHAHLCVCVRHRSEVRERICHNALFLRWLARSRSQERDRRREKELAGEGKPALLSLALGRWQEACCVNALCIRVCARLTALLPPSALTEPPLIKDDTSECPDTHTQKFTNQKVYFLEAVSQEKSGGEKLE